MSAREKSPTVTSAPVVLLGEIRQLIDAARRRAATAVNSELTLLYWRIGNRIRTQVLAGKRAEYGEEILPTLSAELVPVYGKGFSARSLARMMQFAEAFPEEKIVATLSQQLGWSYFVEILPLKQPLQREYYAEMCRVERWRMAQCAHSNGKGDKENLKCQVGISSSPGLAPARDVMRSRFVTALNVKIFNSSQTVMSSRLVESLKSQIVISNREVRLRA